MFGHPSKLVDADDDDDDDVDADGGGGNGIHNGGWMDIGQYFKGNKS